MITSQEFVQAVRDLAAEQPERVDERARVGYACYYAPNESDTKVGNYPGCLIGQALAKLGVSVDDLKRYDGKGQWPQVDLDSILLELVEESEDRFRSFRWASVAQYTQDNGRPWAQAIAEADRQHPLDALVESRGLPSLAAQLDVSAPSEAGTPGQQAQSDGSNS